MSSRLIYGKNPTERVASVEHHGDHAILFVETEDRVEQVRMPAKYWMLHSEKFDKNHEVLDGDLHYRFMLSFDNKNDYFMQKQWDRSNGRDYFALTNDKESYMVRSGVTYFKGMKIEDVSIVSFDIETNGLTMDDSSKIYCIASTYAKGSYRERQVFHDPISWCKWVTQKDPSILLGHNIFGFDLPYMHHISNGLPIGRDGSNLRFAKRESRVRKDGSQSYDYFNALCYGREIVDTFHLALKYDIKREYENYSIKTIAIHEGLARPDRQYYDAAQIADKWDDVEERAKILEYAMDDTEEALDYFYLAAPSYFYYNQSVPKSFQQVISGASGSQVNSIMIRSYIQDRHSIPAASEVKEFQGAISKGNPGVYHNVKKVDVASLYPSIILQYNVYDKLKDPKGNFLSLVDAFTAERLKNKELGRQTGERHYKDLEQAQKIMINSAYGFLGAPKLNFNSPAKAAFITKQGRDILTQGIAWAERNGYVIVNVDTDSFSYVGGTSFDAEIAELNSLYPDRIRWENDGQYEAFLVVKAKNYATKQNGKIKIKGSALKATMKEKALRFFIADCISKLLAGRSNELLLSYNHYARQIANLESIDDWCTKKTITKSVLNPQRTNELRVLDALKGKNIKEGDKVYMFYEDNETLCLKENFRGTYDKKRLYKKLHDTMKIFSTVIDIKSYPNYSLKKNQALLEQFCSHSNRGTEQQYQIPLAGLSQQT